jgi:WD40 repeat protein
VQSAQSSSIDRRFAPARFAVSPRGLVAAASNNSIQLLTKSGGLFRELLKPYAQSISALSFGHSEQLIAAGTTDGRIFLIDLTNLRDVEHLLTGHASAVSSLSFSSDGERLVSASADGTILVHRASMNRLARVLGRHGRPVSTVAFSPDGRLVISGASDQRINFWDVSPAAGLKQPVAVISDGIQQFVECVAFSPDGTVIAANTRSVYVGSNVLQLLNATTRKPIGGGIRVSGQGCNAFRPRRDQIAASRSDAVSLFDVKTTRSSGLSLPCCAGGIDGQLFSADGETLISAADYGKVVTWDLGGEHPRSTVLMDRERSVTSVALNAKGTRLALAGEGWAEIVDLTKPRSTAIEAGIPGRAIGAAFHPTDEFLIVGTDESGIHLLDSRLGEVLEPLQSKGRSLRSVALSPDGRTIAAGYSDGAVMVWSLGLEEWRSIACRVVSRGMSPTEWRRYIGDAPPRDACAPKR